MIWCLSNARSGDLQFGTSFIALRALVREIIPNSIPTYMTQVGFPSIVWLRLRAFGAQPPSEQIVCRHQCPYCTLRVSKTSDHWCAFGTMSNFEKRNLRSGHLMWPGGVTFGVIGSSFFGNVSNCWLNSYGKFGGATRRRFFAICEKPEEGGGWYPPPPAVRGLNDLSVGHTCKVAPRSSTVA